MLYKNELRSKSCNGPNCLSRTTRVECQERGKVIPRKIRSMIIATEQSRVDLLKIGRFQNCLYWVQSRWHLTAEIALGKL